jgi:hypothetical protein
MTAVLQAPETAASLYYPATQTAGGLIGMPRIMELAFRKVDLEPLRRELIARAQRDFGDANALMDLSCVLSTMGQTELALTLQTEALSLSRHFTLQSTQPEKLRLLALMMPGALMDNMPLEFLVNGTDVTLDMLYLEPDPALWPQQWPAHDVACVAVCESPEARPLLDLLTQHMHRLPRPTLNQPARIADLARDTAWRRLQALPGCVMPPSVAVSRAALTTLLDSSEAATSGWADLWRGAHYPIICRPAGSHAGHGLGKIDDDSALAAYLAATDGEQFVVSPFINYISADHQYRKYRIAFVAGQTFPVHLALSARWMVHYLNGDMTDRPDNRAEEQRFFEGFDQGFGLRHAAALAEIDERLGLDYFSIDCAETPEGELLVFECDTGGVAHAMDPLQDFGYKRPHMLRLFAAFRSLLLAAAADRSCLKPEPDGPGY